MACGTPGLSTNGVTTKAPESPHGPGTDGTGPPCAGLGAGGGKPLPLGPQATLGSGPLTSCTQGAAPVLDLWAAEGLSHGKQEETPQDRTPFPASAPRAAWTKVAA